MSTIKRKHVILEGPDGSGKTTLLRKLLESMQLNLIPHAKFSGPEGPDLTTLDYRTNVDLGMIADRTKYYGVYDRYPIISELIYGPIVRQSLTGWFNDTEWTRLGWRILEERTVVVWCLPPLENVIKNVSNDRDMAGVKEKIEEIHKAYTYTADAWTGPKFIYDYTRDNESSVVAFLKENIY